MKFDKTKLLNYKAILGAALAVALIVGALLLDLHRGFLREIVSTVMLISGGAVAGAVFYYLFLDDSEPKPPVEV